jgi:hypothetical protein
MIPGGAGFIGAHLCCHLLKDTHGVSTLRCSATVSLWLQLVAALVLFPGMSLAQDMIPLDGEAVAGDRFGSAVAIDAQHILVGSPYADDDGEISGAVSAFTRDSAGWKAGDRFAVTGAEAFDRFGTAVAIDEPYAIVGARGDDDQGTNVGAAYIFRWTDTTWVEQVKLTVEEIVDGADFGYAVDISGDRVIVGAPGALVADTAGNAGAAYIFERDSIGWSRDTMLVAEEAAPGDHFGHAVGLDSTTAIIGARGVDGVQDDVGAAYIFGHSDGRWSLESSLSAPEPSADDHFGFSVAVAGSRALVGAWGDDTQAAEAGAVYSFVRASGEWTTASTLTAQDGAADDRFGYAVAATGETAVVGSVWSDVHGDGSGASYVYRWEEDSWQQEIKLAPDSLNAGDEFGYAVAVNDHREVLVGARGHDSGGENTGSAWLHGRGPETPVARERSPQVPAESRLRSNFPNPFNPTTTIPYRVASTTTVRLEIFDVRGRLIRRLVDRVHTPGRYRAVWNGKNQPSGMYFYRLTTNHHRETRSMLLLK